MISQWGKSLRASSFWFIRDSRRAALSVLVSVGIAEVRTSPVDGRATVARLVTMSWLVGYSSARIATPGAKIGDERPRGAISNVTAASFQWEAVREMLKKSVVTLLATLITRDGGREIEKEREERDRKKKRERLKVFSMKAQTLAL